MFSSDRQVNGYSTPPGKELNLPDAFSSPRSGDEVEVEVEDPSDVYHLLSNTVRQEYLTYLEKLLYTNYETWMVCNATDEALELNTGDLHACAKILEQRALKSSMIVSLYRKAMLKIIAEIRHETEGRQLSERLLKCHTKVQGKLCNVATQTETENFLIERYFRESATAVSPPSPKRKRKHPKKRKRNATRDKPDTPRVSTEEPTKEKDEVEANLEKLFAQEKDEMDIFDNAGDLDARIKLVLSASNNLLPVVDEKSPKIQVGEVEMPTDALRDSMWPCELRMRRKKLYAIMCVVGESSLRRYERVKGVFGELFGGDSDDEDVPPSPSTDMDPITLSSCRKRIAPTIVKHLMKPFNAGLIANRWLFKKLAKSLADSIVIENDYADDRFVREFIDEYFAIHPQVADVTDIV